MGRMAKWRFNLDVYGNQEQVTLYNAATVSLPKCKVPLYLYTGAVILNSFYFPCMQNIQGVHCSGGTTALYNTVLIRSSDQSRR